MLKEGSEGLETLSAFKYNYRVANNEDSLITESWEEVYPHRLDSCYHNNIPVVWSYLL